jgi:hypothetical protein
MADPDGMDRVDVNMDALKSEIRRQLINQKVCDWCAIFTLPFTFTCTRPNTMPSRLRDRGISNIVFFVIQANACPIAMRMAWHASGTYDKSDGSGGCNGILCTCHLFLISRRTSAVRCEQTLLSFELIFS